MNLKFEFRILDENGDEIISDYVTFDAQRIDAFGGCEAVDIHTGSALRFVRRRDAEIEARRPDPDYDYERRREEVA